MTTIYTISDELTKFCRKAMKANGGVWNPVTNAWMFTNEGDHANAMCELYRATRPSAAQLESLLAMAADGTGAKAWDFDPRVQVTDFSAFSRDEASRLLSAGYTVRRLLGTARSIRRPMFGQMPLTPRHLRRVGGAVLVTATEPLRIRQPKQPLRREGAAAASCRPARVTRSPRREILSAKDDEAPSAQLRAIGQC